MKIDRLSAADEGVELRQPVPFQGLEQDHLADRIWAACQQPLAALGLQFIAAARNRQIAAGGQGVEQQGRGDGVHAAARRDFASRQRAVLEGLEQAEPNARGDRSRQRRGELGLQKRNRDQPKPQTDTLEPGFGNHADLHACLPPLGYGIPVSA